MWAWSGSENRGWGGGFNVLLAKWLETKESDYCFVSAHDSLLQPRCLRMLLDSMQGDSNRIGIACPGYGEAQITKFSPVLGPRLVNCVPASAGHHRVGPVAAWHIDDL